MWTLTLPVIAIGHIDLETRDLLQSKARNQANPKIGITDVAEYEHGFFVRFSEDTPIDNSALQAIRDWMLSAGYLDNWIRLDVDGVELVGLPTYEW